MVYGAKDRWIRSGTGMSMLDSHWRRKMNLRWILKFEWKSPQFYMQALMPGQKVNCCLIKSSNIFQHTV